LGTGEDGPTHQPIEQLSSLRLIPNLNVWRPADVIETAVAWQTALEHNGPSCLLFSRQNLPQQNYDHIAVEQIERGGYIVYSFNDKPDAILMATGSEVHLATQAAERLGKEKISVRVVSMPCPTVFLKQEETYRDSILPSSIKTRVAIEAGVKDYWYQFVGLDGKVIGLNDFGLSAKATDLFDYFDLTVENIVLTTKTLVNKK